jgi:hypothetical protein
MMNLSIFIILIVLLLCAYKNFACGSEPFQNSEIHATRLLGMAKHVRLNKFNRVDSIHIKPPLPRVGETMCMPVTCPEYIPDNTICYKCQ